MRDHTSDHMFGPGTRFGRRRSGSTLSLVPDLDPVPEAGDGAVGGAAVVSAPPGHRPARRRASGPRPVRPAGTPAGRQAAACRTVSRAPGQAWTDQRPVGRERVLVRAPQRPSESLAWKFRVRRAVAGVMAALVTAAVVVGLGLLADGASAARHAGPAGVEQAVTDGSLTPVREVSGQVLGVPVR